MGIRSVGMYLVLWVWHLNLQSCHPVQLDERRCRSGHTTNRKHEITPLTGTEYYHCDY